MQSKLLSGQRRHGQVSQITMEAHRFSNWHGTHSCTPERYYEPTSIEEIKQVLAKARSERTRVKVCGHGHSPNNITCTDGYMINLKKMNAVLNVDEEKRQITVQAGCSIKSLDVDILPKYDMALPVVPCVGEPTIAGAIATGTHATGLQYGTLGSYIIGAKILTAGGEIVACTRERNQDVLRAASCSLGCLGVITEVTIQCDPAFQIHSVVKPSTFDEIMGRVDSFPDEHDHSKFFWWPHTENVIVFNDNRTSGEPVRNDFSWFWVVLMGYHFQQFCMWIGHVLPFLRPLINSFLFKVLANHTVDRVDSSYNIYTYPAMYSQWINEWAIPIEKTKEVLCEIKSRIEASAGLYANFPLEVRFVKGDDGMLSPCHGRDSCFISIITFRPYNRGGINRKFWDLFEDIVKKAEGRPHWAKNHTADPSHLRSVYPEWSKFCAVREKLDPEGLFLNEHLERIFGDKKGSKKDS